MDEEHESPTSEPAPQPVHAETATLAAGNPSAAPSTAPNSAPPPPAFADGAARKLEPGWISAERVFGFVVRAIVGVVAFLVLGAVALTGKIPFPVFALLTFALLGLVGVWLVLSVLMPKWEHARSGYRLLPDRVESWNGLIWRRAVSVPISRVQYTDVQQGPLQRKYGIATLVLHTAGTMSSDIQFEGLPPALANEVRDWLVAQTGSDAV